MLKLVTDPTTRPPRGGMIALARRDIVDWGMAKKRKYYRKLDADSTYRCFYCGEEFVGGAMEADHFPIPACVGGTNVVPACRTCHDLKDRVDFGSFFLMESAIGEMIRELNSYGRFGKIFLARMLRIIIETRPSGWENMVEVCNSCAGEIWAGGLSKKKGTHAKKEGEEVPALQYSIWGGSFRV